MERRDIPGTVSVEDRGDKPPVISGYAAVFYRAGDPKTEYELYPGLVERIAPTAFGEFADVIAPFNHDPSQLLGRMSSGTLRVTVDSVGLRYEIDPPDTTLARDVMALMKRGDVTGSSFAFEPIEAPIVKEGQRQVRTLQKVILHDVGPVTNPAYKGTSAAVRAYGIDDMRNAMALANRIRIALRMAEIDLGMTWK